MGFTIAILMFIFFILTKTAIPQINNNYNENNPVVLFEDDVRFWTWGTTEKET